MDRGTFRGYSPWGHKELEGTEATKHAHTDDRNLPGDSNHCDVKLHTAESQDLTRGPSPGRWLFKV